MARSIYGKDYLIAIRFSHLEKEISFNYWDLWISIVIEAKFDRNLYELEAALKDKLKDHSYRDTSEELLSQLAYYKERLEQYELTPKEIMESIAKLVPDPDFLKQQQRRAVRKIMSLNYSPKDKTVAMENTPRKVKIRSGIEGTLHSFWDGFEVEAMPGDYRDIFKKKFKKSGFYTKHQSFDLEVKLEKNLDKLTKKANTYELFAIYRGFLAVIIKKTGQLDDSFGVIGDLARDVFRKYIALDQKVLGTSPEEYYIDVLNLMLWEDFGFFDGCYEQFFKELPTEDIETVESILREEQQELKQLGYNYQEEVALSFLAYLYTQHESFHKFVPLAEQLGTRRWQPISFLTETAVKHNKKELALSVYEAALKGEEGWHKKSILEKYEALGMVK